MLGRAAPQRLLQGGFPAKCLGVKAKEEAVKGNRTLRIRARGQRTAPAHPATCKAGSEFLGLSEGADTSPGRGSEPVFCLVDHPQGGVLASDVARVGACFRGGLPSDPGLAQHLRPGRQRQPQC